MYFSTAALLLGLRLVAAAPRHHTSNGNMPGQASFGNRFDGFAPKSFETHVSTSEDPEHGISKSIIQVDITTSHQSNSKLDTSEVSITEQVPGWLFFDGMRIQGRIYGNTFWNIKGELDDQFPIKEFFLDSLTYTLNHPMDYDGAFTGTIGRGQVELKWEKSGATIGGRAGVGDFTIKGETHIDWSP